MSTEADQGELLAIAEELYGLPLGEFTPARDARAKSLKGTPEAAAVKKLRKPTTAGWVVDLLVRHETEQVDQILAVGEALREASTGMDAAQLRELTRQRRQLTAAVTTRARALAREHGLRVTPAVADQIEATLTAAMIDEAAAQAVRSGLLVTTLAATGLEPLDVSAAVAVPAALGHVAAPARTERPALHAVPDLPEGPDPAEVEAARADLAAAEESLAQAAARRDEAVADVEEAKTERRRTREQLEEARRELDRLEAALSTLDTRLAGAESARSQAEADHRNRRTARERAAARLSRLS